MHEFSDIPGTVFDRSYNGDHPQWGNMCKDYLDSIWPPPTRISENSPICWLWDSLRSLRMKRTLTVSALCSLPEGSQTKFFLERIGSWIWIIWNSRPVFFIQVQPSSLPNDSAHPYVPMMGTILTLTDLQLSKSGLGLGWVVLSVYELTPPLVSY